MKPVFSYVGPIPASKSIYNRALVIGSYSHLFSIDGTSEAEDILKLKEGLASMEMGLPIDCGHAGTVLRFLSLRASRIPGSHILKGSQRLFSRPQNELVSILKQLGCGVQLDEDQIVIRSEGWRMQGDALHVPALRSSQFASAVLLNAWDLDFDLHISMSHPLVSSSYFKMTCELVKKFGLQIDGFGHELTIPKGQSVQRKSWTVEADMSSAFAVSALAAVAGEARLVHFPSNSIQPDSRFIKLLQDMGAPLLLSDSQLKVGMAESLQGINFNLNNSPDLFPVLAVLCALSKGPSLLSGAAHLIHKESNRIEKISELLRKMGRPHEILEDGLHIFESEKPLSEKTINRLEFEYDCDSDHRLVMAATVAAYAGYNIKIIDIKSVRKSFPEFIDFIKPEMRRWNQ